MLYNNFIKTVKRNIMGVKKMVYVDYENMGNIKKLLPIDGQYFFFIGNTQNSIPKSLVMATNGIKVEWIAIEGSGKNALDFHIAYYLGKHTAEPDTMHYILSKDKGYDPLVLSINKSAKSEIVKRIISLEDLKSHDVKELAENIDPNYTTLVNKLNSMAKGKRPKSEKKLESFIKTQVFSKMDDSAIKKLVDELYRNKIISKGQNNRISY